MGDSENEILKDSYEDITVEEVASKTAKAPKVKATRKNGFFSQVKAEFKKIIWPSSQSLMKQTIAVIVSSVILGVIIFVVDLVIRIGLNLIS